MKKIVLLLVAIMLVVGLAACGKSDSTVQRDAKVTDIYSRQLAGAVPYPLAQMKDSTERRNLREKLLRFNKPDKIGYVYLLTITGKPIGYYSIRGKVSSNDSQMTASQQIVKACSSGCREVVDTMSDDGSYGPNEPGIFFFTTNGVLVVTSATYLYSDSPLPVNAPDLTPKVGQKDISNR